jgi:hypothetical protein
VTIGGMTYKRWPGSGLLPSDDDRAWPSLFLAHRAFMPADGVEQKPCGGSSGRSSLRPREPSAGDGMITFVTENVTQDADDGHCRTMRNMPSAREIVPACAGMAFPSPGGRW